MVRASTRLTHTDARAEEGAWVTAAAAGYAVSRSSEEMTPGGFFRCTLATLRGEELAGRLSLVRDLLLADAAPQELAERMRLAAGVTGYINDTVPAVVFCWLRYSGDFRKTVENAILLGGDADTTGAIAGALAGATTGVEGIPPEWLERILDWPLSLQHLRALARALADMPVAVAPNDYAGLRLCWPAMALRNVLVLPVVLAHGFRRLFPPY